MNAIPRRAKPELALAVQFASGAAELPPRWRLRRWVRAALEKKVALTLRFVDEDEGRALNRDFRDQDHATNVLTFVYADVPKRDALEGDIVICAPVLKREAKAQGRTLEAHCAHLVIHGVLHLQGWDHQGRVEAEEMEAREAELLRRFGYENPYA